MNRLRAFLGIVALVSVLTVGGCTGTESTTSTPPPITGARADVALSWSPPTNPTESPDDIVFTPGGSAYRANVHEQGVPDKWPPIAQVQATLTGGINAISVQYRAHIATKAGEVRNNLLYINRSGGHFDSGAQYTIKLYTVGAPSSIQFYQGSAYGVIGQLATLLVLVVQPDLAPGRYTFGIGVEIDGVDYGALPCTLETAD